ncbi:TPA: peptide chain release factor 1 [Candidatus Poribacteria bacterium]|nr:peptide chain release factor 1 [Candidatus Poribacteria bacterium]HEX29099.1 peptide chain release factor 1 [Candidatus Poribacteria bacterium]
MLEKLQPKLDEIERRYAEIEREMLDPEVLSDPRKIQQLSRALAEISPVIETYERLKSVLKDINDAKAILETERDEEMIDFLRDELKKLQDERERIEDELKLLLIPKDPNDERNVIMEIRAGTGGEEAALFAADLFRMYTKYAKRKGWQVEIMSSHPTELKGFKEIIFAIEGQGAYSRLKFEGGVHRVQRIPVTETGGRIHTSAVTVAVLPEAEEVDVEIRDEDLRVDVYRSSGHGGQHVNTTDSAVRITHIPTGIVVTCQDERSQHKNKAKALKILRARLLDMKQREMESQRAIARRNMVGSGDRSERIRTYNFPQNRVTDDRINLTLYKLDAIMEGDLDLIIEPLILADQAERLKQLQIEGN